MYISVVEIDLPPGIDVPALKALFCESGRRYADVDGLLRKYYTLQDDKTTGGVFVWDTLEHAKAGHADPAWHKLIMDRYGSAPRVSYYEVPVVVDNLMGDVLKASEYLQATA